MMSVFHGHGQNHTVVRVVPTNNIKLERVVTSSCAMVNSVRTYVSTTAPSDRLPFRIFSKVRGRQVTWNPRRAVKPTQMQSSGRFNNSETQIAIVCQDLDFPNRIIIVNNREQLFEFPA